jgi:hypothetical protein
MELNVTPDLVRDLYEYAQRTGRPSQTGIVLADEGWETRVWTDHSDTPYTGVIACTAEDIDTLCDGEPFDDDVADMLTRPSDPATGRDDYRIPDEHGEHTSPYGDDLDPIVVAGEVDDDGETDESWTSAWWFDRAQATLIVAENGRLGDVAAVTSLWRTATGRWVTQTRQVTGDGRDHWAELSAEQAATFIYDADPALVAADEPVPLVAAAVAARELVDALTPPVIPRGERPLADRAEQVLDDMTEAVDTARAVSELLRRRVLADVRQQRATAAWRVNAAFGHGHGARARAAEHLGMSPQTLSNLIGDVDE